MILAKPGPFKGGEVLYKYHLQKLLFYLWKKLEEDEYGDSLPRDNFVAAANGPVPEHLNDDLERFEKGGWVKTRNEKWEKAVSKRIILTSKGQSLALAS